MFGFSQSGVGNKVGSFTFHSEKILKVTMPKRHYSWEFWALPKQIMERKDLTHLQKCVLSVLITRHNGENPLKIKEETIAQYVGSTVRSVRTAMKQLSKKEIVIKGRDWKMNTYDLSEEKFSCDRRK